MALIVQKFGGSSVADAERVMNVASIVADTYRDGNDVIVVVSAQGDTTDDLIAKAEEINPKHSRREMDQLLSAGEQISISLLAMALEKLRIPVISLLGWQAGFKTNSQYTMARIKKIDVDRVNSELDKNKVIYTHCGGGGRALTCGEILKQQGFDVRPLKPGYKQLIKAGFENEEGAKK